MSEPDYSPRNRTATSLPSLIIEVEHADGILRFNPNSQIMHLIENTEDVLRFKPVPGQVSLISGQPAIVCRMDDMVIPITPWEYVGLVGIELQPNEFKALRDHFGDAFEWHDDFYDEETGEAIQPRSIRDGIRDRAIALRLISPDAPRSAPEIPDEDDEPAIARDAP